MAGNGWKWLDMAKMAGHFLDWLKRARNDFKWLEMAGIRWTGSSLVMTGCKWMEMDGHD